MNEWQIAYNEYMNLCISKELPIKTFDDWKKQFEEAEGHKTALGLHDPIDWEKRVRLIKQQRDESLRRMEGHRLNPLPGASCHNCGCHCTGECKR